jgi:CheY-like chemotaxis protein
MRMKSEERHPAAEATDRLSSGALLRGVRVLLVEPEDDYRHEVSAGLRLRGGAVASAGSVPEALQALAVFGPDVLVVDLELPPSELGTLRERVDGLALRKGRGIPAVAMTPAAMLEGRQRAREAGFQLQVSRPVEPSRLAAAIARLVPRPGPRRELRSEVRA